MPMSTHPDIYTGTDDFAKLLLSSNVFVDKSLFVKEFLLNSGEAVLITRPRRWGKSLNMNMLGRFLAIEVDQDGQPISQEQSLNRKLFLGGEVALKPGKTKQLAPLNIAQYDEVVEDYQGQFPVISLGLKDIKADSYDKIFKKLRKTLVNLFETHAYLLNTNIMASHERELFDEYLQEKSDEINIQNSLQFLSKLLHRHFNKPVYILIDEYDTPINHAYLKFKDKAPEVFDQVVELFRDLMGKALKSNEYLKKGLVTGILRIAKANIFSDWNNVAEYTLLDDEFATAYGFTQEDVDA
ncbi:MAG: AAA family ATPase [Bacteroidota bacterium]